MPRGNTGRADLIDLVGAYGGTGANAQELIDAQRDQYTPSLRQATLSRPDDDATEKLIEEGGFDKANSLVDDGEVIDLRVRPPWVICTVEIPSGRTYKVEFPAEKFNVPESKTHVRQVVGQDHGSETETEAAERKVRLEAAVEAAEAQRTAEDKAQAARKAASAPRAKSPETKD